VRGPAPNVRVACRCRTELPRSGRRAGHLDRHRHEPAVLRSPKAASLFEYANNLMKLDRIDPERGPTPEQLGAYADGELSAPDRATIDSWLRRHPAHAAEVDALRSLTQLWHDTPPPQPSAHAWYTAPNT